MQLTEKDKMDLMGTKLEETDEEVQETVFTFWGFFTLAVQQLVGERWSIMTANVKGG